MFSPLYPPARSPLWWGASLVGHVAIIAVLIDIPVALKIAPQRQVVTLIEPLPIPPPKPLPPIVVRRHITRVMPMPIVTPAILSPVPSRPLPTVPVLPEAPKIEATQMAAAPHIDLPPPPIAPKPPLQIKLGGFGDPNGAAPSPTSNSHLIAKAGAFDLPQGPGHGGAAGQAKVVASAGFGDGGPWTGGNGNSSAASHGTVKSAGFGDIQTQAAANPNPAPSRVPAQTPVEIISKPRPAYTPEARASKLEGEVLLEVVFSSAGAVQVIKVVRGLGLGLDESARQAASQIRFRPGTRDGVPVDMKGIVHIVFELS